MRVIDLFREWDKNQDGTVSKKEFRVGVEQMGFDVPKVSTAQRSTPHHTTPHHTTPHQTIARPRREPGAQPPASATVRQILKHPILPIPYPPPQADVHGLFDSWDPYGSGLLDLTELHRVLRKGGKLEKKRKMIHPDTITVAELMQPGSPNASGRTALRKEKAKRASALGTIDLEEGDGST